MYTIMVVGGGYTGKRAALTFAEKKQKVILVSRSAPSLKHPFIEYVQADLTQPETLCRIPSAHFIIYTAAPDERTEAAYESIYVSGAANLLAAIQRNPRPFLFLYLSSSGVYGSEIQGNVDESILPAPISRRGQILKRAESQILNSGFPSIIFRLSGIYGPGRNRYERLLAGQFEPPAEDRFMNMIHVDDIIQALPLIMNRGEAGSVYLGVDDGPVLASEFYAWLLRRAGKSMSYEIKKPESGHFGKVLKNTRLKSLGLKLMFPSFREGYEKIIAGNS